MFVLHAELRYEFAIGSVDAMLSVKVKGVTYLIIYWYSCVRASPKLNEISTTQPN